MKFIHYLSVLVLFASSQQSFSKDSCSKNSCPLANISLQSKRVSCCAHVITAADIGTTGFVISTPGQWCLGEDVTYNPSGTNPAIRIAAAAVGNVTLDLNCKTLAQASKNVLHIAGVLVDPGLTNVTIKNGTIRDFSDAGIRVGVVPAAANQLVTELNIADIRSFNNGSTSVLVDPNSVGEGMGGIVILNAQDVTITHCNLNENIFAGLRVFNITKFTMDECHCDDTTSTAWTTPNFPIAAGATFDGTINDIVIRNSTFNRTSSAALATGLSLGFLITGPGNNVLVDSCQINDTKAILNDPVVAAVFNTGQVVALAPFGVTNATINNCQVNGTSFTLNTPLGTGGNVSSIAIELDSVTDASITNVEADGTSLVLNAPAAPTLPSVTLIGIRLLFSSNCTLLNCTTSNQAVTNNSTVGAAISMQGVGMTFASNCTLLNCTTLNQVAMNNSPIGGTITNQGFGCFAGSQITMNNCHADNNTSVDTNVPAQLVTEGFSFAAAQNVILEDCTASGHTQAGSNPAGQFSQVGGFRASFFLCQFFPCGPIVFRRCIALGNTDTGTGNGLAFGFSTRETNAPTLTGINGPFVFDSCVAESNTNGSGTGSGFDIINLADSEILNNIITRNNIGINITDFAPFASNDNTISSNIISANTNFGIQDLSAGSSNAYYSNRAKNNGPTPVTTNYSGVVFPIPGCPGDCVSQNLTPLLYWLLPNAPCDLNTNCIAPTPFDNLCIVN